MRHAVVFIAVVLCGCVTASHRADGWADANSVNVGRNAEIAETAGTLLAARETASAAYWAATGDTDQRILAAVTAIESRRTLKAARAAGLTGSDAEILLGIALAGALQEVPP